MKDAKNKGSRRFVLRFQKPLRPGECVAGSESLQDCPEKPLHQCVMVKPKMLDHGTSLMKAQSQNGASPREGAYVLQVIELQKWSLEPRWLFKSPMSDLEFQGMFAVCPARFQYCFYQIIHRYDPNPSFWNENAYSVLLYIRTTSYLVFYFIGAHR